MKDLLGNETIDDDSVNVNIYADESGRECPINKNKWYYIGLVIENLAHPLLPDIINERYRYNMDKNSPYYEKNNKIVHWCEIRTADEKNICKRWFEYILAPDKSKKSFHSYILGLNDTSITGTVLFSDKTHWNEYPKINFLCRSILTRTSNTSWKR